MGEWYPSLHSLFTTDHSLLAASIRPRKRLQRGADDLTAGGRYAQHREAALVGAVGAETEDAIDAGEARRVGQHLVGKALRPLRLHQRGDQRDRVVGERGSAHRIAAEAGAVPGGKIAIAARFRRREPGALQPAVAEDLRVVPQ